MSHKPVERMSEREKRVLAEQRAECFKTIGIIALFAMIVMFFDNVS